MISSNINRIREEIRKRCEQIGRNPEDIKLIAVSKKKPLASILKAYENGVIHFGENKAQELRDKFDEISVEINWHFIGHLQKNKAKYVVKSAELFHALDSIQLADEISKRAEKLNKIQNCLLEIKTSPEESKFGLEDESEIDKLLRHCRSLSNIKVSGLMTMAPYTEDKNLIRSCFKKLKSLLDKLNDKGHGLTELSMGMTSDYLIAIEEGSTMVRIGTAIFGARNN